MTTRHHRSLLMLCCALVVGATAAARSRAEAPDASQATSLTVAEATVIAKTDGNLSLPRLAALTPDVAGILARHDYGLRLDGLVAIPPAVAAALRQEGSGHVTRLILPLPPDTPVDTLRELARADFNLEFSGPVTITADIADALARYEKVLTFSGPVAPLEPDVARRLVLPGMLVISNPIVLSDEVARILGERRGDLWITGLTSLTPGVARVLAGRRESIVFKQPLSIDAECAAILATYGGPRLDLRGASSLEPEAARALTRFPGALDLGGLETLPLDVAAILTDHASWLYVGVTTLSRELAAVLARHRGGLGINRVASLEPDVARALSATPGELQLLRLRTLDAATAAALAEHRGELDVSNLESLPLDAARALMAHEGTVKFDKLPVVDIALAEVFASRRAGLLTLLSPDELSPEAAEVLARNPNIRFPYWKLRTLTPEAAAGLAQWPEDLAFDLESLTPETAAALAPHGKNLRLKGITALDGTDAVEVARALAMKRGSVALPYLKRITPRALVAIAEKAEVDIDNFESLELVPDEGGANDDIVLPKAFLERQRRRR